MWVLFVFATMSNQSNAKIKANIHVIVFYTYMYTIVHEFFCLFIFYGLYILNTFIDYCLYSNI